MIEPLIQTLGAGALTLQPGSATLECQQRIWHIAAEAARWPQVHDVVPGMNNLTILFNPLTADVAALSDKLQQAWHSGSISKKNGRNIDIPVCYGGVNGPDLAYVAERAGLSPAEVIERHSAAQYIVYFIGFQPGFPYLGGLDPQLHTPRRSVPRAAVPAGAVGIGGSQTGIYPAAAPGGWQLIGRSALRLFDPSQQPPTLLQAGDRVRFIASTLNL